MILLVVLCVLIVVLLAKLVPAMLRDDVDTARLRQIAQGEIVKNCQEEVAKKRITLDCSRLEISQPERLSGSIMDPVEYSVGGSIKDESGEAIWYSSVNLYPSGKIVISEVTRFDPVTNEYVSETKTLDP
jgi:hypothetical protein